MIGRFSANELEHQAVPCELGEVLVLWRPEHFPRVCAIVLPGPGQRAVKGSRAAERENPLAAALARYFAGERGRFAWRDLDVEALTPFATAVSKALFAVKWGKLTTYGELAAAAGHPGAARAVGQVMAHNPLPIVIPCHRVLAAGGGLGGFSSGLDHKRWLLRHEGITEF